MLKSGYHQSSSIVDLDIWSSFCVAHSIFLLLYIVIYIPWPVQGLDLKSWRSENHFMVRSIVLRPILRQCAMTVFFYFLASCHVCTNSCACLWREGFVFLSVFFFFRCQNHIDFDILKTCRAELKIVVHGVDVGVRLKFLELLTIYR